LFSSWQSILGRCSHIDPDVDFFHKPPPIAKGKGNGKGDVIDCYLASSNAVVALACMMTVVNQVRQPIKRIAKGWLNGIVARALEGHSKRRCRHVLTLLDTNLTITEAGHVFGWEPFIRMLNPAIQSEWRLHLAEQQCDVITVGTLLQFVIANSHSKHATDNTKEVLMDALSEFLNNFVVPCFEHYVLAVYAAASGLTALPRVLRFSSGRICGTLDRESAWSVLERTRLCRSTSSVNTIIELKNDEGYLNGLSSSNGSTWAAKELSLHVLLSKGVFANVKKIMLTADPSTYQGENTLVGILWSWEKKIAAMGLIQIIAEGKHLRPGEFEMDDEAWARVATSNNERTTALKELQAVSAMIWHYLTSPMGPRTAPLKNWK